MTHQVMKEKHSERGGNKYTSHARQRRNRGNVSSASFRIAAELSTVEKALTKQDFAAMQAPLGEILRALKPLRLQSLQDLDFNTRGKLITSLVRVLRAPKPEPSKGTRVDGEVSAASSEEVSTDTTAVDAAPLEVDSTEPVPRQAESTVTDRPALQATEVHPAVGTGPTDWHDASFKVGLIWHSVAEKDRAELAFQAASRMPTEADLAMPEPSAEKDDGYGHQLRKKKRLHSKRGAVRSRDENRTATRSFSKSSGDWRKDACSLEENGRTRDAGRLHEAHESYAEAARLFELGGDLKSAFRSVVQGRLDDAFAVLSAKLDPKEVVDILQRAKAWDRLMGFHVARSDFAAIARLYERAMQFDQAGLAWEHIGQFSLARKAYKRAKDFSAVGRVRELEVQKLIKIGNCFGAATLLMGVGKKDEALQVLKALPGMKAFHFMGKLNLHDEAKALAQVELAKAAAADNKSLQARWLELTCELAAAAKMHLTLGNHEQAANIFEKHGDFAQAAQLMETAGRFDKAQALFERHGDQTNAARVRALSHAKADLDVNV